MKRQIELPDLVRACVEAQLAGFDDRVDGLVAQMTWVERKIVTVALLLAMAYLKCWIWWTHKRPRGNE